MSSSTTLDAAAIQALVAEVVRRIQAGQATAASRSPVSSTPLRPAPAAGFAITERVITLASIERVPAGVHAVSAVANAVITPSAADRARERGIAIVRSGATPESVPSRPFVIAQAACRGDVAGRTAAIARTIPGAQQLPASGLADVVTAVAAHASRDAARGVLLTSRPAVAMVLANRSPSLRAVSGRDAAAIMAAAHDAAANLLIVDPATFSAGSLERLCTDFHRSPSAALPAELQAAPPGCGCTTHSH